ncbi:unnamed protein product [Rotaria sordida]|uniref:Mitochondrial import inner membrane translocase subunit n=1 Tax=Rotaria sordida TaxID=392033 RepID=A0A819DHY4_9BILA|nr:unnamed protein product [Rotaria sordida]CAF1120438.1 unnamed protein product [Rotaria sordida]CAF1208064.1 unnamed protein product [Rotaria sordida]CAF1496922.1 unnamed protein product [Rotaria sordida]CAF3771186.1 unnamed protein product [Rotaria sordida]
MSLSSLANDPELQKFVAAKELENQLTTQVHHLTNICFDKCVESSGSLSDLSAKQTTCLQNCVERFLDCTMLITNRTVQRIQQGR